MTTEMIITLAILVIMIVMMMMDRFPFGAPPLIAGFLLVITGVSTISEAFAGLVNPSVIMVAGFMVVMAALMKTSLIDKVQSTMTSLVNRGGYKSYALLVLVVMLGAGLAGTGNTGYYVLILSLVSTIPYNKKLPTSKLMMPLGFSTNHPLIPLNVALLYGVTVSVLEGSGFAGGVSTMRFAIVNLIVSLAFLAWALISYRFMPDHPIAEPAVDENETESGKSLKMETWKEYSTIGAFIVSVIGMMLLDQLGDIAYAIPGLAASFVLIINVVDFKEFRENFFAPVVLLMAGVIGVADALANSGFTEMIGNIVAEVIGTNLHPFFLILILVTLTSLMATFTGSNMGSVFIFAPIGIATFMGLGLNPVAVAAAITISGWNGHFMPIDGMAAMIYGMGKYSLLDFWKFTIPMYLIRVVAISAGSLLLFPVA